MTTKNSRIPESIQKIRKPTPPPSRFHKVDKKDPKKDRKKTKQKLKRYEYESK